MKNLAWATLCVALSGCMFAPGQHVKPSQPLFGIGSDDEGPVRMVAITPRVVAETTQSLIPTDLPAELLAEEPQPYRLGPGDLVHIQLFDPTQQQPPVQNNLDAAARVVDHEGSVFFPFAGRVPVSGVTIEEFRDDLTRRLARFIVNPQVDVRLVRSLSQRVSVSGAFINKVPLDVTQIPLTLADALGRANVDAERADFSGLTLTREGRRYVLDLDRLTNQGAELDRVYLKAGDTLHLPYNDQKKVYLMGEIRTPASLTYRTSTISLADALGRGGSLLQNSANPKAAYVIRNTSATEDLVTQATVYHMNLNDPLALVLADRFQLTAGDVVYVGAPNIVRFNRFISQLFPFGTLVRTLDDLSLSQ